MYSFCGCCRRRARPPTDSTRGPRQHPLQRGARSMRACAGMRACTQRTQRTHGPQGAVPAAQRVPWRNGVVARLSGRPRQHTRTASNHTPGQMRRTHTRCCTRSVARLCSQRAMQARSYRRDGRAMPSPPLHTGHAASVSAAILPRFCCDSAAILPFSLQRSAATLPLFCRDSTFWRVEYAPSPGSAARPLSCHRVILPLATAAHPPKGHVARTGGRRPRPRRLTLTLKLRRYGQLCATRPAALGSWIAWPGLPIAPRSHGAA